MGNLDKSFREPVGILLLVLVIMSLAGAWAYTKQAPGLDYYVAWVASDAVNQDNPNNIYDPASMYTLAVLYRNKADAANDSPRQKKIAAHWRELPMTGTPFLYWVTGHLATGNYEKDLTNWHLLSLFLATSSILLMCHLLGYSATASMAILLPVLVWFTPFQSELRVANVNSFQLGLLGLVIWLQSRGINNRQVFLTGLATGLLVMYKPNLGPVAVLLAGSWVVRAQLKQLGFSLAGMTTGAAVAVLLSSWWMSSASAWLDWLKVLQGITSNGPGESGGNYAMAATFFGSISPLMQLLLALSLCAICLAFFWWGQKSQPDGDGGANDGYTDRIIRENIMLVATGCIITMLASTLVWLHYYMLILPVLIVILRPWQENRPMGALSVIMMRILPVLVFVCFLDSAIPALTGMDSRSYWETITMAGTLVLLIISLWQFAYGIRDRNVSPSTAEYQ